MGSLMFLVSAVLGCLLYFLMKTTKRERNYPPGPPFAPWVGNSIQLHKEARSLGGFQHKVFEKWSRQYKSKIIGLKLSSQPVVVVLSQPLVHEVHCSEVFEGRPDNFFLRLRTMGTRLGITCTDGKLWHEHRNFAIRQLRHVGYAKVQMQQHIEREANNLLHLIMSTSEAPVWPGSFLAPSVLNVLWSLTAGKGIERDNARLVRVLELLRERSKVFDMSGGILAQFPWLRFIAPNKTGYNLVRRLNQELSSLLMETVEEHKASIAAENSESDFIYAYIKEMRTRDSVENNTFNETQLTMTVLDFFIAGSQTTSNTLDLAIMMLALREDLQQKVYGEIAEQLSDNIEVKEPVPNTTKRNYPIVHAFFMEVQRFFHIVPIGGPRRALWNTKLGDYDIPKDTTILIGLESVLMDTDHWKDPAEFRPDRFLDTEGRIIVDEYFVPFGQGRRRCLGDALARACLFSFLVKIVQRFKIVYEGDATECQLELLPGIVLTPKPYKVKFIERQQLI